MYPKLKIRKLREDMCDVCERIRLQLKNPGLSEECKETLKAELEEHLGPAKIQRRVWSNHVLKYARSLDSEFSVSGSIIPATTHDPIPEVLNAPVCPKVILEAHDFGGSLPLPHYGIRRPGVDYYQSNLMQHNFIMCKIGRQEHRIMFYDERDQGKGADACISMRMIHYLRKLSELRAAGLKPEEEVSLMVLMDNCTGQNKTRAVMQFFCMLNAEYSFQESCTFLFCNGSHKDDRGSCCRLVEESSKGQKLLLSG